MFPTQERPYLRLQRSDVERPNLAWHPWKSHILQSTIPCNLWEGALAPPPKFFATLTYTYTVRQSSHILHDDQTG